MVDRQEEENIENEEIKEIESGWQKRRSKQIGVFLLPLGDIAVKMEPNQQD